MLKSLHALCFMLWGWGVYSGGADWRVVLVTPDACPSPFMLWGCGVYSGGGDWRVVLVTPDACPSPYMLWGCGV